jgi:hypothetical protein
MTSVYINSGCEGHVVGRFTPCKRRATWGLVSFQRWVSARYYCTQHKELKRKLGYTDRHFFRLHKSSGKRES